MMKHNFIYNAVVQRIQPILLKAPTRFFFPTWSPRLSMTFAHSTRMDIHLSLLPWFMLQSVCVHPQAPDFLHAYAPKLSLHHRLEYVSMNCIHHHWALVEQQHQHPLAHRTIPYSLFSLLSVTLFTQTTFLCLVLVGFVLLPYLEAPFPVLVVYSVFFVSAQFSVPNHFETFNSALFMNQLKTFLSLLPLTKEQAWEEPCVMEWVSREELHLHCPPSF